MTSTLYIGMISGTSRDGVDAALVSFEDGQPGLLEAICVPYPSALAASLQQAVVKGQKPEESVLISLDKQLAEHFSATVHQLLSKTGIAAQDVTAIGSHGQTVWHAPDGPQPETIQLGDPQLIADETRIRTVGDFRRADMEAGGQGAPLAPLLHRALFTPSQSSSTSTRVVLNLGGIANVSIIERDGKVSGFDTGPANCLLDAWIQKHKGQAYDRGGRWSAEGTVIADLLRDMLNDPYFLKPAPKSTGIETFNLSWLERFGGVATGDARDIQSTLAELTAATVAMDVYPHDPADILVCGGGAHNPDLLGRIQSRLPGTAVHSTADFGLHPDWVEAVLFAWLAQERLSERPLNTASITGASSPVLLGRVANPR